MAECDAPADDKEDKTMKKIICIAVLCIACALSFYGCSGKNDKNGGRDKLNMNIVMGKIEAIDGNKVTLNLADTDSMFGGERPNGDFGSFNKDEMPENFNPEDFEGEMPEGFDLESFKNGERPDFPEGERPEGTDGSRPDFQNGEKPEGFMPQAGGMMNFDPSSLTYSGETEEYTVPEGMKIGDGDYTSLKVDDVIIIRFDNEGGISEIMVMTAEKATEETTAA